MKKKHTGGLSDFEHTQEFNTLSNVIKEKPVMFTGLFTGLFITFTRVKHKVPYYADNFPEMQLPDLSELDIS